MDFEIKLLEQVAKQAYGLAEVISHCTKKRSRSTRSHPHYHIKHPTASTIHSPSILQTMTHHQPQYLQPHPHPQHLHPTTQTCLPWALGTCPNSSQTCSHPHHFYPTIIYRTLPPSQQSVLKSLRCPLWPSYLCPWSSPDLCPYAHETTSEAENSVKMQKAAGRLHMLEIECGQCGKCGKRGRHFCWKRKNKKGGDAEGILEGRVEEERKEAKSLRTLIDEEWKQIRDADEDGLWPGNEELRSAKEKFERNRKRWKGKEVVRERGRLSTQEVKARISALRNMS